MDSNKSLQHNDLLQELIKSYEKQNNLCYKSIMENLKKSLLEVRISYSNW